MTDNHIPDSVPPVRSGPPDPRAGDQSAAVLQGSASGTADGPGDALPPPANDPGKTMGIVAFIMSWFVTFFLIQIVALILGIIAHRKSKKAGFPNRWAVAAIIISSVLMVLTIIVAILLGMAFGSGRW